jgi:hypothetical protein
MGRLTGEAHPDAIRITNRREHELSGPVAGRVSERERALRTRHIDKANRTPKVADLAE